MIAPEYCVTLARYNGWQNKQIKAAVRDLPEAALREERGVFFGSLLGTLNHLLWGDLLWMSRFDGGPAPDSDITKSVDLTPDPAAWDLERFRADARILAWAEGLHAVDLTGGLTWPSRAVGREVSRPVSLCISHMFNHQTHHRGQVHAILTAMGAKAPVSDLFAMPEDGPWV